jgi:5-methylcytosine-specific restriction protein A
MDKPAQHNARQLRDRKHAREQARGTAAERGYDWAWQQAAAEFRRLPANWWCVLCRAEGTIKRAECVDHIKPARVCSDQEFWDHEHNWAALCIACNNAKREEDRIKWPVI